MTTEQHSYLDILKMTTINLEMQTELLDICFIVQKCHPDNEHIKSYCCTNYESCELFRYKNKEYDNGTELILGHT